MYNIFRYIEEIIITVKTEKCRLLYKMLTAHADDKCAMYGKALIRSLYNKKKEKEQQLNSTATIIIIEEQIDASCCTFDISQQETVH